MHQARLSELRIIASCSPSIGRLTPLQALQTATLNPAKVFKRETDFGVIETGKLADLVLLDANPLDDIRNTQRIAGVVVRGKLLRLNDLDGLLRAGEEMANRN